jgi:DNA-binding transcriptional MerR regulator
MFLLYLYVIMKKISKKEAENIDLAQFTATVLGERIFAAKDAAGVSYRMLNYWHTQGFLLRTQQAGEWRKFDFYELVWIHIVDELRSLGIEVKNIIEPLKREFEAPRLEQAVSEDKGWIWPRKEAPPIDKGDSGINYPFYFVIALNLCLRLRHMMTVRVYKGPRCEILTSEKPAFDALVQSKIDFSESYISISVTEIIAKILNGKGFSDVIEQTLYNNEELLLLAFVRDEAAKGAITQIVVSYGGGVECTINIDSTISTAQLTQKIMEILLGPYEKITYTFKNGIISSINRNKTI